MPETTEKTNTLKLADLPTFYRNKPRNRELFGRIAGAPDSGHGYAHMLLLFAPWHDQLARHIEQDITSPSYDEEVLSEEKVAKLKVLVDQIRCVAALTRIVEKGPGTLSMLVDELSLTTDLSQFVQDHPYFYITAREQGQDGKDPRYVAKLENLLTSGYSYPNKSVNMEAIVSDEKGVHGRFPTNTTHWQLAHLATTPMVNITSNFRYLNDGYR